MSVCRLRYEHTYLYSAEGLAPVDLLLLMAAKENDAPKVAELIRAGADINTKVKLDCSRREAYHRSIALQSIWHRSVAQKSGALCATNETILRVLRQAPVMIAGHRWKDGKGSCQYRVGAGFAE